MRDPSARLDRWGPPVAFGVALAGASASLVAAVLGWWGWRTGAGAYPSLPSDAVVGFLFPLAGALLVSRRPRNGAGWVLMSAALVGVSALAHQWVHLSVTGDAPLPMLPTALWLSAWTFAPYWLQTGLLPLLFPDGRPPSARWGKVAVVLVVFATLGTVAAAFRPDPDLENFGLANPLGIGPPEWSSAYVVVMVVGVVVSMHVGGMLGVASLVLRIRRSTGRVRAQLQWLVMGFATAILLVIPSILELGPRSVREILWSLGFAAIPASIMIAVIRHQLLDIEIVLNRTVVYGALTALGLTAYFALVWAIGPWLGQRRAGPFAAAVVALSAAMGRERLQRAVDRRLFGARDDPSRVMGQVGASLDAVSSPTEALRSLVQVLRQSLVLPYVAVEAADDSVGAPDFASGRVVAGVEEFPIVIGGRRLGTLLVGHRHRGERLRPGERAALDDVARRAGGVLEAAALTSELRRSRERVVAAREEERRRIRHDLHDGLGPALAGLALQVDGIETRLPAGSELTERAARLRCDLKSTVSEVRRIVDGLRPAALDELGLAEALLQLAADAGRRVTVDVPRAFSALPAAVEVAAYRIACEGVTNALRHSGGANCHVRAVVDEGDLELEVSDDGIGFPADRVAGLGLASMHERAAEVGGTLVVSQRPVGGTSVLARLPVGAGVDETRV